MSANATTLKTWTTSQEEEDRMYDGHMHHWATMISHVSERDLSGKHLLDFGCNQGGFLRNLYKMRPFKSAVGVDLAAESLQKARELSAGLPVRFELADQLSGMKGAFDIAFSHEVIYLLQDLDAHAKVIADALKSGGVYYAATGCHTENPLWPKWHKAISDYSNIPVPHYSLNDYAAAFANNGFGVELMSFRSEGFITAETDDDVYYPSLMDKLKYYAQDKVLFRFSKSK